MLYGKMLIDFGKNDIFIVITDYNGLKFSTPENLDNN
jgi:hypothetical protein